MRLEDELVVVGDVHGDALLLERLLHKIPQNIRIVFTGDLVNRGPSSREVMNIVANLVSKSKAHLIRGNHEEYLMDFLNGGDFVEFALRGGIPTILSYLPSVVGDVRQSLVAAFPESHRQLLEGSLQEFKSDGLVVRHWDSRAEQSLPSYNQSNEEPLLVVGHLPQREAVLRNGVVFLDSGAGTSGGSLSAFFWPSGTFMSVRH